MTPLAAAMPAASEGLDPVLQLTCRDRNRLALTADLLGAHALGIRAVLCLSGDLMEVGRTGAKPVFDLDAVGLTRLKQRRLRQGRAPGGTAIDLPARFLVGAAEAPGADPSGGARLAAKADAGATFAQTQPIYDVTSSPPGWTAWPLAASPSGWPSCRHPLAHLGRPARTVRHLPGWSVPDAVLDRMRSARDQRAEGITLAVEMVQAVRDLSGVRGIHSWASALPPPSPRWRQPPASSPAQPQPEPSDLPPGLQWSP